MPCPSLPQVKPAINIPALKTEGVFSFTSWSTPLSAPSAVEFTGTVCIWLWLNADTTAVIASFFDPVIFSEPQRDKAWGI